MDEEKNKEKKIMSLLEKSHNRDVTILNGLKRMQDAAHSAPIDLDGRVRDPRMTDVVTVTTDKYHQLLVAKETLDRYHKDFLS